MKERNNHGEQLAMLHKQMGYSGTTEDLPATLPVKTTVDYDLLLQKLEVNTVHKNMTMSYLNKILSVTVRPLW